MRLLALTLLGWVLLGSGPAQAQALLDSPPSAPNVLGVELHHPQGFDPSGLESLIGVRAGQPLSTREVQRSIERLFATGRLADVVVRGVPQHTGIRVVFELTPVRRIGSVYVEGASVLGDAEVLEASGVSEGTEFHPETVERAIEGVKRLYWRRGYRAAQVQAEGLEREGALEMVIRIDEGTPTRVLGVTFAGNPGLPLTRLLPTLGLAVGEVLDEEVLEPGVEALRELYRQEGFYRARVGDIETQLEDAGVRVLVPVDAGPRFVFHFHGNRSYPEAQLASVLGYDGVESLDRSVMGRLARRVELFYRYRGFHDVRVRPREVQNVTGSRAVVAFDVDEGRPLYVREIHFEGNRRVPDERLLEILATSIRETAPVVDSGPALDDPLQLEGRSSGGARFSAPLPEAETVYVPEAYRHAVERMEGYYRSRGYLRSKVTFQGVEQDIDGGTAVARFQVDEGPRTMLVFARYHGEPSGFKAHPHAGLGFGVPLVSDRMETARTQIQRALHEQGYLFARVEYETSLSADGKKGEADFYLEPGPQVRVGRVILQGLVRSRERMVRRNVLLTEGELLNPDALYETQRNLVALSIFRQVTVRLLAPDTPEPVKDVVIDVRERPRLAGEFGGGYSLEDGPRLVMDATYPNLTGRGVNVSLRGKVNYVPASARVLSGRVDGADLQGFDGLGGRGNLSFHQPRIYGLLPTQVGARLDLVGERVHRPGYRFTRLASIFGLDWTALDWLTVSLQYELEYDTVRTFSTTTGGSESQCRVGDVIVECARPVAEERFLFEPGTFALQSLRPVVTMDFRDDPTRPRLGALLTGSMELTRDISARLTPPGEPEEDARIYTFKISGNATGYVPLSSKLVLALSFRGGKIFRLDPQSRTVGPKRFFLGGASSLRGFGEDALLPQDRREALRGELENCRSLANPAGCSRNAQVLERGERVFSGGGEIFALGKAELRLPLFSAIDLGLFFEAGNLWLDARTLDLTTLRYVSGFGLRYNTPIGPLALDLGLNLQPDREVNESTYAVHFSIGVF